MNRPGSFNEGLRKDVERRLRAAIAKLSDRAVDAAIEDMCGPGGGPGFDEEMRLDRHIHRLRYAVARVVADGRLELHPDAEEALAAAEEPRRRPCAAPARPKREPEPAPAPAKAKAPPAPAKGPPAPRTYKVDLTGAAAVGSASGRAAGLGRPRELPSPQEPLFGRPLMLPAHLPGKDEA